MNKFAKIKDDLDKTAKDKIKIILSKYKYSQKRMVDELSAVILENWQDDRISIITNDFVATIQKDIKNNLNEVAKFETEYMQAVLEDAYQKAVEETAKTIGVRIDFNLVNNEAIKAAVNTPINGQRFSKRIWQNVNDLANNIYDDVIEIVKYGNRPDAIARQIKKDYGVTAFQSKRLVNTELARVVNDGQLNVYRNSEVVKKVMWSATLENNTCPDCAELDGKYFLLDDAPNLPKHPCCRCCLIPVVDDWQPTQRADNETKSNIDYVTYNQWV